MDHIQDVYKKKPEMINKIWDHLTKVNLKVDGKPFQVVYNEEEDELEYHGRSGNETKVGPLIDDMQRLFSKPINDAIRHIEKRVDVFKRYKFLTFEVISEILLLTAIIDKDGNFIDNPDEIDKIAKELDTDVMPCLWKGKLSDEQRDTLMNAISSDIIPTKGDFIKWVKGLFGTYEKFPKTLISRSGDFIEGLVFFYEVDGKVVEYKLVDPSYAQSVKDNQLKNKQDAEKNSEVFNDIYTTFVDWGEKNGKALDKNRMRSIEFNFIEMMKDPKIYNKLMKDGACLTTKMTDAYFLQLDRVSEELRKAIRKHGKVYQLLYEKFVKLFYKAKKRAFVVSQDFQARVNKLVEKFADYSLNEDEIEVNGIFMLNEENIEDVKTYLKQAIDNETSKEKINKINTYVTSLNENNKHLLYNWCWLKFPDSKKISNFYKELKNALRSSAGFSDFIKDICENQIENQSNKDTKENNNIYELKDEQDSSFIKLSDIINTNQNIGSFNLIDVLNKKWKDITNKTWNAIHDISFGPQPVVGKSEILFRVISHPGKNNKFGGDVLLFGNGAEIKDYGVTNAKLGRPDILNTEPIFKFLNIKEKIAIGSTSNKILSKIEKKYLSPELFENVFIDYFKDKDKESQITNIIKSLSNLIVSLLIDSINNNDIQLFLNIWGTFYLFCYSVIENFNLFICTAKKDNLCYEYNYIVLNDKNKDLFNKILEKQPFRTYNIRKSGNWIDITFNKL